MFVNSGTFFHWLDKPICANCGTKTVAIGPVQPTSEDLRWEAGRVEGFKCPKCGKDERFPRYNHPRKLLGKLSCPTPFLCFILQFRLTCTAKIQLVTGICLLVSLFIILFYLFRVSNKSLLVRCKKNSQ